VSFLSLEIASLARFLPFSESSVAWDDYFELYDEELFGF
jgi:hypothetical protein